MKMTFNLIFEKIFENNKNLLLNCILYSCLSAAFSVLWVLFPRIVIRALNDTQQLLSVALPFGIIVSIMVFGKTYLEHKAWMKINNIRYLFIIDLINYSLSVPYQKTLDTNYIKKLSQAREATMQPELGIGAIILTIYHFPSAIIAIFGFSWILSELSLPFMFFVCLNTIISYYLSKQIDQIENREWKETSNLKRKQEKVYDIMLDQTYAKDIRIFGFEKPLDSCGRNYSTDIKKININFHKIKIKYQIAMNLIDMLSNIVIFSYISYQIIIAKIDLALFLSYSLAVIALNQQLKYILTKSNQIKKEQKRFSAFYQIKKLAEYKTDKQLYTISTDKFQIEFVNLTFTYPNSEHAVIKNFSYKINSGERVAIVGLNGAGKSTLIKLICRLYSASSGQILLNGININDIDLKTYYNLLSVVFQDGQSLPYSIIDNITLSTKADQKSYQTAIKISDFLAVQNKLKQAEQTYLSTIIDDEGIELSGGQKQKMLLARALYQRGKIFLLDEPESMLDPVAEEKLYQRYRQITDNKTSIIISHRLSFTRFCDKIILLENGSLLESGTHQELLNLKGKYYQIFDKQRKKYENN